MCLIYGRGTRVATCRYIILPPQNNQLNIICVSYITRLLVTLPARNELYSFNIAGAKETGTGHGYIQYPMLEIDLFFFVTKLGQVKSRMINFF